MIKYVLTALAVVAAIAALVFRPPLGFEGKSALPGTERSATDRSAPADGTPPGAERFDRAPAQRSPPREASSGVVVYVAGEVMRPGVYRLPAGRRAQAALAIAGGPKPDADLVAVNLAQPLEDGEEIAFPKIGADAPRPRRSNSAHGRTKGGRSAHGRRRRAHRPDAPVADDSAALHRIDLNAADASALQQLPGIGPALAERIVAYRELNGRFASVDELADVSGITPGLQEKIADFVFVR